MRREDITGLVLAGGQGRRMGGVDKGLQPYRGQPLAGWMLERLAPQVGRLMVSANRNLDIYRGFGVPVCRDASSAFEGPLAGMLSGLAACRTPCLAAVPCDTPSFPPDLVARLAEALEHDAADLAVASVRTPQGSRLQPVFALVRVALRSDLQAFRIGGGTRVREWMFRHRCAQVEFDDPAAFANINTLQELSQAHRQG